VHGNQIISVVCQVSSGKEPRIIHFQHPIRIITEDIAVLQQLIQKYYIRVNEQKYYKSYVYKSFIQILQTISFYLLILNKIAWLTSSYSTYRYHPAQGWEYNTFTAIYHLLEPTYNMDKTLSVAGVHLQQGLTNPEYLRVLNKTYPTKRKDTKGMPA